MGILQNIIQKVAFPGIDTNRLQGKASNNDLPTSKELRYRTLQKIFSILASEIDYELMTQKVVDFMVDEMDFIGGVLFIPDDQNQRLIAWSYTHSLLGKTVVSWLPKPFREYTYPYDLESNLAVRAYKEKKEFVVEKMSETISPAVPANLSNTMQTFMGMKLCITLPIIFQQRVLGVLLFTSARTETNEEEMGMLKTFAEQVGIAINNSNLFSQINHQVGLLEVQNNDLKSLYNLTSQISTSLDPTQVAQTAVNSLPQDKFIIGALLNTYDKEKNKFEVKALTQNGISYEVTKAIGDPAQYGLDLNSSGAEFNMAVKALKQGVSQFSNKLEDFLAPSVPGALIPVVEKILQIKSVATYPLKIRDTVIGTLTYFIKEKTVEELTESEKQLLGTYTYHITISLENAELYKQQQETQANLENALMEVQALRQHEQDMIDIMGHELRTPISIVRNALGMLELELKNTGEIKKENLAKFLDISMESARREVKLVETLLSSAKADSRGFQLLFEKVDFLDVINDSLEFFTREAEKKGLQIKYSKPNEEFWIYADRTRIQEVMDNLLSNAVKYTDKGFIKINIRKDGEFAWIDITDTGIGMNDKDLKSIGQKFYRVDQYMDKEETVNEKPNIIRPGGTGLGLYVTFSLVKVMDGKVEVKSQLGVGTTFSFSMPLYKGQESKQEQRKP